MGGLLAFRVGNFDNTAEREQFRFLCERLKSHYENSNEFCVFVGNYSIGCELDALFIKKDAIIAIEFKNYGGHVIANENGEWKCDGKTIKGGSRKTVLQQARINHSLLKRELKALGIAKNNIKDIPTLIIFNQPIDLENNLGFTTKMWLHITDNDHFIHKLDDLTCPHTNLDPLGIINLAEQLKLNPFYLEEYSNAKYDNPSTPQNFAGMADIDNSEINQKNDDICITNDTEDVHQLIELSDEESLELKKFALQILKMVIKETECNVKILDGYSSRLTFSRYSIEVKKNYIVTIEKEGVGQYREKLSRLLGREVEEISSKMICWQEGNDIIKESESAQPINGRSDEPSTMNYRQVSFRKSRTILPYWLDQKLFTDLNAIYSPEHERYEYNLNLNVDEVKVYLGTYFPRSYAESFCVFDNLLKNASYYQEIARHDSLRLFDIGCGTGGELIGLIVALEKHFTNSKQIDIVAMDGNTKSLDALEELMNEMASHTHHKLSIQIINQVIASEDDLSFNLEKESFDFILCSKMICELMSKKILHNNTYYKVSNALSDMLSPIGVMYVLDVTTKDLESDMFYPQLMNKGLNTFVIEHPEFATLLPLACGCWVGCRNACFIQQTIIVSHSHKDTDQSRVCYRVICRSNFKGIIIPNINDIKEKTHIIHPIKYKKDDDSSLCSHSKKDKEPIDTYNLILK